MKGENVLFSWKKMKIMYFSKWLLYKWPVFISLLSLPLILEALCQFSGKSFYL